VEIKFYFNSILYTLDYETKQKYEIIVEAKDYGDIETIIWPSILSYADITITIEDVNYEKPQIIFTIPDKNNNKNYVKIMNISKLKLHKGLLFLRKIYLVLH
jgi:hypothetical protein